jgi:hypothetical protein
MGAKNPSRKKSRKQQAGSTAQLNDRNDPDQVAVAVSTSDMSPDENVRPQRVGFFVAAVLFAGWLAFLGYLASLTWKNQ